MSSKKHKKDKKAKHEDEPMHTNDDKFEDGDDAELMEFDEEFDAEMDMESEAIHGLDDKPSNSKYDGKTKDKERSKNKKSTSDKHPSKHKTDDQHETEEEPKSKGRGKGKSKGGDKPVKISKKKVEKSSAEMELDSDSVITEDSELDETSKIGRGKRKSKKEKAQEGKEKKDRRKTKPVRPPRGKCKKPMTARKLPLKSPGVARKLPIEEAEEDVQIDWAFDDTAIKDQQIANFERSRIEEKYRYLEREKINLENEFVYMKTDLDQKTKLITELKADYDRLRSDFDNYKRRMRSDVKEKQKFASEKLVRELLEVLDNFDRTNQLDINNADKEDILKGIQLIQNQMLDILGKEGLKTITAKGEPFDPYVHDAVTTTDTDDHPHNTVLEDLQKGYKFKGKVLRPSKVRVSQSEINPPIPIKREEKKKEKAKDKKKDKGKKPKKESKKSSKKEKISDQEKEGSKDTHKKKKISDGEELGKEKRMRQEQKRKKKYKSEINETEIKKDKDKDKEKHNKKDKKKMKDSQFKKSKLKHISDLDLGKKKKKHK